MDRVPSRPALSGPISLVYSNQRQPLIRFAFGDTGLAEGRNALFKAGVPCLGFSDASSLGQVVAFWPEHHGGKKSASCPLGHHLGRAP